MKNDQIGAVARGAVGNRELDGDALGGVAIAVNQFREIGGADFFFRAAPSLGVIVGDVAEFFSRAGLDELQVAVSEGFLEEVCFEEVHG